MPPSVASRNLVFGHCEILPSKAGSFRLVLYIGECLSLSVSVCKGVAGQTVGPILTKICMWCKFFMGVPTLCPKVKNCQKGLRWPPIKKLHKMKVVRDV